MGSSPSSVLSAEAPPARRLGAETPRIFTPPLRRLTPETSAGFECITFAEEVLGISLFPWQKWLLIHALEMLPDGTYRFRTVVILVARQNGKSTLMQVLSLWRMYVDGAPHSSRLSPRQNSRHFDQLRQRQEPTT